MLNHTLLYPIKSATGQTITKISMRRPKRGDYKKAFKFSKDVVEQEDFMISQMAGITLEDVDEIDMADSAVITRFLRGDDARKGNADAGRNTEGSDEHTAVGD